MECKVEGCGNRVAVKKHGLCSAHYQRMYKGIEIDSPVPQRRVEKCPVRVCDRYISTGGVCSMHASVAWRMSIPRMELVEALNAGECAICGPGFLASDLQVDHDHSCCDGNYSCGKCVRGVLCRFHNILAYGVEAGKSRDEKVQERS